MFLIPQEDFSAFIHCEGFKSLGRNFSNMQKFHYLLHHVNNRVDLRVQKLSLLYTSKILCLELHMEFYKVAGDFLVTIVTVNLVPHGQILYICIYFRNWGGGMEEVVHLM